MGCFCVLLLKGGYFGKILNPVYSVYPVVRALQCLVVRCGQNNSLNSDDSEYSVVRD